MAARMNLDERKAKVEELARQKTDDRHKLDETLAQPGEPMISCHVPHFCRQQEIAHFRAEECVAAFSVWIDGIQA